MATQDEQLIGFTVDGDCRDRIQPVVDSLTALADACGGSLCQVTSHNTQGVVIVSSVYCFAGTQAALFEAEAAPIRDAYGASVPWMGKGVEVKTFRTTQAEQKSILAERLDLR